MVLVRLTWASLVAYVISIIISWADLFSFLSGFIRILYGFVVTGHSVFSRIWWPGNYVLLTGPPHDKTNKMTCAPSEDSDQPGHPPSLVRVFAVRMKKHWALTYPLSAQWRLWSDWMDAQADLSLHWAHMSFCCFCRAAAHVSFVLSSTVITSLWEERIGRCAGRLLVCPRSVVLLFYYRIRPN